MQDIQVNRKMFYQIADIIEQYPEKHEQEFWFMSQDRAISTTAIYNDRLDFENTIIYDGVEYKCDTTQCIAGWSLVLDKRNIYFANGSTYVDDVEVARHYDDIGVPTSLSQPVNDNESIIDIASKILGISIEDGHLLFHTMDIEQEDWPTVLRAIGDGKDIQSALDDVRCEKPIWNR
jgi:hypothetical protein